MTPQTFFDPYLIQQASCRASHLVANSGLSRDDWEDLRQEMLLDCLQRTPNFDPARGDWRGFVRGVIRNRCCVLARRESRRLRFESLAEDCGENDAGQDLEREFRDQAWEPVTANPGAALALSADVQRVLAGLPENLRTLAWQLTEMSVAEIAARRGRSHQWIYHLIGKLRTAFSLAGVTPAGSPGSGGAR